MTGLCTADTRAWRGVGGGGDRWLQWPWEGQEAQDPPARAPHTQRCQRPRLGSRQMPPGGTSPYKENRLALKSQIGEVAKIVAAVPTFRIQ